MKPNSGTLYYIHHFFGPIGAPKEKGKIPTGEELATNGKLSGKAKSRLRTAVNWLVELAEEKTFLHPDPEKLDADGYRLEVTYKVGFMTLTLPAKQKHSDYEILEKAFQPFMKRIIQKYGDKVKADNKRGYKYELNYVWKAERQKSKEQACDVVLINSNEEINNSKRGNIHFHLVIDKFIWYADIRDIWNEFMHKLGYIDDYRKNMQEWHKDGFRVREDLLQYRTDGKHNTKQIWPLENQQKAYQYGIETNWSNPNSTDIHSVRKVDDLAAYLCKYMAKDGLSLKDQQEYERLKEQISFDEKGFFICIPDGFCDDLGTRDRQNKYVEHLKNQIEEFEAYIVDCRLWDCSQSLERVKLVFDVDEELIGGELISVLNSPEYKERKALIDYAKAKQKEEMKAAGIAVPDDEKEFFTIIPFSVSELKRMKAEKILKRYTEFIDQVRSDLKAGKMKRDKNEGKTIDLPTVYASDMAA